MPGRLHGAGGDPALLEPELRRAVLDGLVTRMLLLAEAARQGIVLQPEELAKRQEQLFSKLAPDVFKHNLAVHGISQEQWQRELADQLLMEKALRLILRPQIRVTPKMITDYYQGHREEFYRPEQILAQHALLPNKGMAQKLVDQVQEGKDMSQAAEQMGAPWPGRAAHLAEPGPHAAGPGSQGLRPESGPAGRASAQSLWFPCAAGDGQASGQLPQLGPGRAGDTEKTGRSKAGGAGRFLARGAKGQIGYNL